MTKITMNPKLIMALKVIFVIAILVITFTTATSMYRASNQYQQVKDCIDKGGKPKECDILVYGEPKEMLGGLNH